ncbi:hypothetical protein M430DRAFT_42194 [Amorphotheca resinae ATCC 22711]|uniref:Uncharacterized protein n=1 Tax=Amorphotheca resinae ATCC 22711 TaxID=857342 RepID=A0A2T3B1V2_AMORE|nr:hypothetical protein M430DRAFT_42194 [Amorphotheca resinae ATCC 22711]PSS18523.1 hypothetical protein M430DRAFT_42194 [Amorphotheca resinae ATCC 22711]
MPSSTHLRCPLSTPSPATVPEQDIIVLVVPGHVAYEVRRCRAVRDSLAPRVRNGVVSDPQHAAAHALEAQCVAATLASISRPFSFQVSSDPRQTLPRTSLADEGAYQAHFAACTICGPAAEAGRVIARHFLNWPGRGERGNFAPPPPISAHPLEVE